MIEEVLLVRHGETPGNRHRIVQTPDTPLSEVGRRQAQRAAQRIQEQLRGERRVLLVSSDYLRAAQTAKAVARACGASVHSEPLLRERNFGHLRGQAYEDLRRRQIDPFAADYAPPGGEDWETFDRRVSRAWGRLRDQVEKDLADADPTLLVCVTHGLVLRRLLDLHLTADGHDIPENWANTSITAVDPAAPHAVRLLNCSAHLEDPSSSDAETISGL